MKLEEITKLLGARIHVRGRACIKDIDINTVAACDLMSDVLKHWDHGVDMLLTGLNTVQAVRTGSVASVKAIILVRGKIPTPAVIEVAKEEEISLFSTDSSLFDASGMLYATGMRHKSTET